MHHAARPDVYVAPDDTPAGEAWFMQSLENPGEQLLVALKDREIVGLVQVALQEVAKTSILRQRRVARIDALGVCASDRRMGVGSALMQAAIDWAEQQGASEMQLGVDAFNEGAIEFYRKLGFAITQHRMAVPLPVGDTG